MVSFEGSSPEGKSAYIQSEVFKTKHLNISVECLNIQKSHDRDNFSTLRDSYDKDKSVS